MEAAEETHTKAELQVAEEGRPVTPPVPTVSGRSSRMVSKGHLRIFSKSSAVTVDQDEITWRAYILYGLVYYFAHWFGERHFDTNGDGEFDARDVQHAHNRVGRKLHISFTAPTAKRTRKAQKRRGVAKPTQGGPAEDSNGGSNAERDVKHEEVLVEHLRQFYPWFCICIAIVLPAVWAGYAFQLDSYHRTASSMRYLKSWVVKEFAPGEKNKKECEWECSRMASCVGFSYDFRPDAICVLLNDVHSIDGFCNGDRWCGVYQFAKKPMSFFDTFAVLGGLETAYPGETILAGRTFCEDGIEFEAWRLLTYQLTHVGLQHVFFNALLVLLFGIPLEGCLGTIWMAALWNCGVVGGGLAWMVWDAHSQTAGASGGCYALVGMHLADTILNWRVKEFRYQTLIFCSLVLTLEFILTLQSDSSMYSHSVHAGGLLTGLLTGLVFGLDLDESCGAKICKLVTLLFGCCLLALVLAWWYIANDSFPATTNIRREKPYCWLGQVCLPTDEVAKCAYTCARCASRECMESWYEEREDGKRSDAVYGTSVATVPVCEEVGFTDLDGAP